jgi:hypothetical protein
VVAELLLSSKALTERQLFIIHGSFASRRTRRSIMTVIKATSANSRMAKQSRGGVVRPILGLLLVMVCWIGYDYYFVIQQQHEGNASTGLLTNQALLMRLDHKASDSTAPVDAVLDSSNNYILDDKQTLFSAVNQRLLGPDAYGLGCHASCGCPETPVDCPRWYNTTDIRESCRQGGNQHLLVILHQSKMRAMQLCNDTDTTLLVADETKGGWCLHRDAECTAYECIIKHHHPKAASFPLPQQHVVAYRQVVTELAMMIESEGITSISDFGSGVGQYKAKILDRFPPPTALLQYIAYDGAGNIDSYTKGQVQYFDLTVPLALPISDWVMCLEVGEHVPSKYEGMVIRNLHRHNRRGIIFSWSVLGQKGLAHVNNHSPRYILTIFQELGYTLDTNLTGRFRTPSKQKYWWFHESIMVLRRYDHSL